MRKGLGKKRVDPLEPSAGSPKHLHTQGLIWTSWSQCGVDLGHLTEAGARWGRRPPACPCGQGSPAEP